MNKQSDEQWPGITKLSRTPEDDLVLFRNSWLQLSIHLIICTMCSVVSSVIEWNKQNEKPWVIFHINYAFSPGSNLYKHGNNSTYVQTRFFFKANKRHIEIPEETLSCIVWTFYTSSYSNSRSCFRKEQGLTRSLYVLLSRYQVRQQQTHMKHLVNWLTKYLLDYLEKLLRVPDEKRNAIIEFLNVSLQITCQHLENEKQGEKKKEKKKIIIKVHLTVMESAVKSEPEVITFFGQMMCGANIVARLIADILLTCWLRAVWYSRSSNNFNRLRLAGGSNMKSSWKASIWRSLSGTFVLFPSSSKRVNSGHSEKMELL